MRGTAYVLLPRDGTEATAVASTLTHTQPGPQCCSVPASASLPASFMSPCYCSPPEQSACHPPPPLLLPSIGARLTGTRRRTLMSSSTSSSSFYSRFIVRHSSLTNFLPTAARLLPLLLFNQVNAINDSRRHQRMLATITSRDSAAHFLLIRNQREVKNVPLFSRLEATVQTIHLSFWKCKRVLLLFDPLSFSSCVTCLASPAQQEPSGGAAAVVGLQPSMSPTRRRRLLILTTAAAHASLFCIILLCGYSATAANEQMSVTHSGDRCLLFQLEICVAHLATERSRE